MYNIHLLPAEYGDSILIEYGDENDLKYILIDGGPYYNAEVIFASIQAIAPNLMELELLVVTHIDIDHIDGIVTLLNRDELPFGIKDIWYNGYKEIRNAVDTLGELQGEYLSELIKTRGISHNSHFPAGTVVIDDYNDLPSISLDGGMQITLLSPARSDLKKLAAEWEAYLEEMGEDFDFAKKLEEDARYQADWLGDSTIEELQEESVSGDTSAANKSSIAFLATYNNKTCLFAGDATSGSLLNSIEPKLEREETEALKIDAWKLAHHGSKKSNLHELMEKVDCKKILVSSNGSKYKHPDDACIAKLIGINGPDLKFYFNYNSDFNKRWANEDLQEEYNFKSYYPDQGKSGITIKL